MEKKGIDKRTIIGIIVIALVLILTPYYYKWISGDKGESIVEADTTGTASTDLTSTTDEVYDSARAREPELSAVSDTLPEKLALETTEPPETDTILEKHIYVQTKRYDITLSTDGGDIVSLVSREFLDLDGKPFEFCPSEITGANLPVVAYSGDRLITTVGLKFVADSDSLILDDNNSEGAVTFVAMLPGGGIVQRRYHFRYEDYAFDHTILFGGDTAALQIDESVLWWRKGLEPSDPEIKQNVSGNYKIGYMMGGSYDDEKFGKNDTLRLSFDGTTEFVATHNKYFVVILAPYEGVASGVRGEGVWYSAEKFGDEKREIPALGVGLAKIGGEAPVKRHDIVYIGPRDYDILKRYGRGFEKTVYLGWSWLAPLTKLFLSIFNILYNFLGNYGLVIIVFSILIKIVLLPLSRSQLKSMARIKELEPKLSELREKYKSDVKRLNEETMKLYQKEKVNPMGGCLPLLPQMPVFLSLFALLRNSFALRGAPFILWIQDLSQKDPYYILPILMGITMFIQQKISMRDPKQKLLVYLMPAFFLFILRNMPAGLVLYWLMFNLFSLVQTLWVERQSASKSEVELYTEDG